MPYLSFAQSHRRHELMSKLCFFFLDSQSIEYFKVEKHFLLCNIACWSKLMDNSTNFRHFWYQWNHTTYRTHRIIFLYKWNFLIWLVCFRLRFFFYIFLWNCTNKSDVHFKFHCSTIYYCSFFPQVNHIKREYMHISIHWYISYIQMQTKNTVIWWIIDYFFKQQNY